MELNRKFALTAGAVAVAAAAAIAVKKSIDGIKIGEIDIAADDYNGMPAEDRNTIKSTFDGPIHC